MRVKRFYIDEATERDETGLVRAARWRLCDTRESARARAALMSGGERGRRRRQQSQRVNESGADVVANVEKDGQ